MTRQIVTTTPHNSGLGDPAFTAFEKVNANDAELYAAAGVTGASALSAATYAIARTLTGTTTGDRLQVLGRTTQSDGGQGLFTWVAGGSTTVDEGYVLQATGGTWQRQDPSPTVGETLLNAVWFNIKPGNADTVNDTGFAKLKAQMKTSGITTWRVYFPPGAYTYVNARWLFGVGRVIIDAYDCTFQCTSSDASNGGPLDVGRFTEERGDVPWPGSAVYVNGYKFNTTAISATSITTTTAADAGNFSAGMRVVLMGYDQQGSGSPPNLRYFEYKTVLTAVAGTGVITFTDLVRNFYDSRWYDQLYPDGDQLLHGAPRILSLERANFTQPKLIWIKGAKFLANPNVAGAILLSLKADLLIYEDVEAILFADELMQTHMISRCKFTGSSLNQSTPDKLIDRLIIQDSLIEGAVGLQPALTDCVGVNDLSLIRCRMACAISQIAPRNLFVDDCDISPISGSFGGITTETLRPLRSVTIKNTRVCNPGGGNFTNAFLNKASPGFSLTVGSVVGTDIRITFDATGKNVMYQIEYGMTLTNTVTGNTGIITDIYYETGSPGTLRIAGTWSAPTAADVFHYYDVMQISDGGGNNIIGAQVPFWGGPPVPSMPASLVNGTLTATRIQLPGTGNFIQQLAGADVIDIYTGNSKRAELSANGLFLLAGIPLRLVTGGSGDAAGTAVLVGGTVTVNTALANSSNTIIIAFCLISGGTPGFLRVSAISNGTSFTILSSSGTDTSTVGWIIFRTN